jgi:hypothetical protein
MSKETTHKMTDHSIAHVAKLIQIAMLTGTDVVDHLRSVEFMLDENGDLTPSSNSLSSLGSEIESMFTDLENDAQNNEDLTLEPNTQKASIFEV